MPIITRFVVRSKRNRARLGLLFTIVVVQRLTAHDAVLGRFDRPLLAVGIMTRLADRIVSDYIEDQVIGTIVDDLVGFVWLEEKRIARSDLDLAAAVPHGAAPGDNVI